MIKISDLNQLI